MQCSRCKKELSDSAKFCGYCGEALIPKNDCGGENKEKGAGEKKKAKAILLAVALALSLLIGSMLGYLNARRYIDLGSIFRSNSFHWSEASDV